MIDKFTISQNALKFFMRIFPFLSVYPPCLIWGREIKWWEGWCKGKEPIHGHTVRWTYIGWKNLDRVLGFNCGSHSYVIGVSLVSRLPIEPDANNFCPLFTRWFLYSFETVINRDLHSLDRVRCNLLFCNVRNYFPRWKHHQIQCLICK